MWLAIYLHADAHGPVDLLVRRRGKVCRVPDCHRVQAVWTCPHRNQQGAPLLRETDRPIYFMVQRPWPHEIDHYRRR